MKNKNNKYLLPVIALVLAQILWGINTPVIKLGLQSVALPIYHSVTITGAALLILPMALRSWKKLSVNDYALLIIGSVLAISVGNVMLLMGLKLVPSVYAPLIGLLSPVTLVVLSVQLLKEKLNRKVLLGVLVSFVGAVIVVVRPWDVSSYSPEFVVGSALLFGSMICGVAGTLICKTTLKKAGSYQVTFIHLFTGILPVLVYSLVYFGKLETKFIDARGIYAMLFNIVAVAGANALYMYGLKLKKAQSVAVFSYIHPLVTAIAAWVLLEETLNNSLILGGIIIFIGVYLAQSDKRARSN